jgi:hypothetical protein
MTKKYPPNSLFTWFPLVKDIMNTPKTVTIPMAKRFGDDEEVLAYNRPSADPEMRRLVSKAQKAVKTLGGYPIFLRSDETSHKHDWVDSCYVTSDDGVEKGIKSIYEFTLMVMFGLDFHGVAVSEFLKLKTGFHAFNGMPIAREFRFFIRDGEVLCRHPYWPPASIRRADREDWLPVLKEMSRIDDVEETLLKVYSREIAAAVKGVNPPHDYWSIDFCETEDGYWYLTDMARGENSYHWGTCENAKLGEHPEFEDPEDISEATTLKGEEEEMSRFKSKWEKIRESKEVKT